MEETLRKALGSARLRDRLSTSLEDLDKLRELESDIADNDHLCSILEDEVLNRIGSCQDDAYMQCLCGMLKSLTPNKWLERKERLVSAVCDASFSGGLILLELALKSNILGKEDVVDIADRLPRSALLQTLRYIPDEDFAIEAAVRLSDECNLIMFLVHALHGNPGAVERFLSKPECSERLNTALEKHYDSPDPLIRKFCLALLKVHLASTKNSNGDFLVNMLTVSEQKQVHLVEPVLNSFVSAVRQPEWSEVPWTLLVFRRFFDHQTAWVKVHSLRAFFGLVDFNLKVFKSHNESFYLGPFLNSLDHVTLYAREPSARIGTAAAIGSCFRRWLRDMSESLEQDRFDGFLTAFVDAVCSKQWNSLALLYISEAIVNLQPRAILSDLTVIFTLFSLWRSQEPLLQKVVTRYWLQIGCMFSRAVSDDNLARFINRFVEECECVRYFVVKLKREQLTPVDICSAIWSENHAEETLETRFLGAHNTDLWYSIYRLRNIASIRPGLDRVLSSREIQRSAFSMLKKGKFSNLAMRAVYEMFSRCEIDHSLLPDTIRHPETEWVFFCLSSSRFLKCNPSLLESYMGLLLHGPIERLDLDEAFDMTWGVLDCFTKLCVSHPEYSSKMLDFACNALRKVSPEMTPLLLQLLLTSMQRAPTENTRLAGIVLLAWETTLETRRAGSRFADCVEVFVKIFFHPRTDSARHICLGVRSRLFDEVKNYASKMAWFGEKFYLAIIYLLEKNPEFFYDLVEEVAEGICYGPTFRKDQKVVLDAENYVLTTHNSPEFRELSECQSAVNVRAKCISFAKKLDPAHVDLVVYKIRAYDMAVSSTRRRYFNNSNIHRVKTRAWQAILVLLDSDFPTKEEILESILDQLMNDAHQMTVRILMEWCAVKILLTTETHSSSIAIIVSAIEKASGERIGCICSYLNILMHLCCAANDCGLISASVPVVLPWTMCQHFAVRLHAQFIFKRILELCRCSSNCHSQYEPQLEALTKVINYGGGAKNATKLHKDFYMADCVMTECETYDLLFDKIPRAYGLTDVDCIPAGLFEFDAKFSKNSERNVETEIQLEVLTEDAARPDETTVVQENNFQRKIIPVSALFEEDRHPVVDKDGLIVVASLIDRLPNLGGITRTCEIFGVSELALPNLQMLETKEFRNLSVSSHQWLPIRGVGVQSLELYLKEKKKNGYTLIGVEQTVRSISLEKFSFPKKSLLLLGNEKEGMPLHLIDLMDAVVEIPQQGVVRSLNVHVSAAILIWEYRKQFLTVKKNCKENHHM